MLEGVRLVADLLDAGLTLHSGLYDPDQLRTTAAGLALLHRIGTLPQCQPASAAVVKAACDTTNPQGVVAVAAWPDLPITQRQLFVVCDEIQDPGNLGTILRSAAAVGVDAVFCTIGCVDLYSPKTVRASMGGLFRIPVRSELSWETLAPVLADTTVVVADGVPGAVPYTRVDWRRPHTLVVGNEGHGSSAAAHRHAAHAVAIPMQAGVESLNAAMAATIMLFEAQRQNTQ